MNWVLRIIRIIIKIGGVEVLGFNLDRYVIFLFPFGDTAAPWQVRLPRSGTLQQILKLHFKYASPQNAQNFPILYRCCWIFRNLYQPLPFWGVSSKNSPDTHSNKTENPSKTNQSSARFQGPGTATQRILRRK